MKPEIFTPELLSVLLWISLGKLLVIGLFTILRSLPAYQKLRVYQINISSEQIAREIKAAWVVITDGIALALLACFDLIKFAPNSLSNILLTFVLFFVWVEIWFYWTHRWMHQSELLWKVHEHHHLSVVNQPLTATSFSFMEKFVFYTLGWFSLPTLLSWYIPLSPYGIAAYFTLYYIASAIAHSNTEFSYSIQKYMPLGLDKLWGSGTGHAIHHARYDVNFGLITSVLDRVLATYAPDTQKVQERVSSGQSLSSLQEVL